jgi:hypothetical protein
MAHWRTTTQVLGKSKYQLVVLLAWNTRFFSVSLAVGCTLDCEAHLIYRFCFVFRWQVGIGALLTCQVSAELLKRDISRRARTSYAYKFIMRVTLPR